jgi:transcriptional regulator with XRE-family HTH domain
MDNQAEVREFLRTRRARVTPADAGLIGGGRRRVRGLRREEVATLAAVSTDYYAKMERGNVAGVSPEVLDAVAQALRLDEAETEHLHHLARSAGPAIRRFAYTTAAGSLTEDRVKLLGSLAASEAAGDNVNRPPPTS